MSTALVSLQDKTGDIQRDSAAIVVSDQQSMDAAGLFLTTVIMPLRKEIVATFDPIKKKAHATWKEACDQETRHLAPVAEAERVVKSRIGAYAQEQERKRMEEQRRLEAEQRRVAENERKERIALEKSLGATRKEIQEIKAEPIYVAPVEVASSVAPVAGLSTRKLWKVEITDKLKFIQHVAAHPDLSYLLDVNESFLNGLVKNQKGEISFPGIRTYQETTVAAKGR